MSRKVPSRCIFLLSTRRAELMSLSRTDTCITRMPSKGVCSAPTVAAKGEPSGLGSAPRRLGLPQIDRGGLALITAFELEAHPLAFVQVTHARALDSRDVHEHILRSVLRLNEAVALLGIEPLHG